MDTAPNLPASIPAAQHPALLSEIGNLVNESGGVSGLTQQFEQKGLGVLMQSWIASGPNPPIGAQQIVDVIGQERVAAIAAKVGLSEAQVVSGISVVLPEIIDGLTPNGTVPTHSPDIYQTAFSLLKSRFLGN